MHAQRTYIFDATTIFRWRGAAASMIGTVSLSRHRRQGRRYRPTCTLRQTPPKKKTYLGRSTQQQFDGVRNSSRCRNTSHHVANFIFIVNKVYFCTGMGASDPVVYLARTL